MYLQTHTRQSSASSSIRSSWSLSDDVANDRETQFVAGECSARRDLDRSRQGSACLVRSCGGMSVDATRQLWKCMLELQQRYGCYNSTRMDLAVGAGDDALDLMPNPFILDTLNDSVVDLPDEGWEALCRYLPDPPVAK